MCPSPPPPGEKYKNTKWQRCPVGLPVCPHGLIIIKVTRQAKPYVRLDFRVCTVDDLFVQPMCATHVNHVNNLEGGRSYFWLGSSLTNLHLPGF